MSAWVARELGEPVHTYRIALDAIRQGDAAQLRFVELPPTRRREGMLGYRPARVTELAHYDARVPLAQLASRAVEDAELTPDSRIHLATIRAACGTWAGDEAMDTLARWRWWSEELEEMLVAAGPVAS